MMVPHRVNLWSNVDSTLYPSKQDKFCIILFSNSFVCILIITCFICHLRRRWPVNCVTPTAYRMQPEELSSLKEKQETL